MFDAAETLAGYWEQRAQKFVRRNDGLAAVCSYGMPKFYNRAIELCQRRALLPHLNRFAGKDILEVGCGIGRWTERLVRNENRVCAIDLSPTMVGETERRLAEAGLYADLHVANIAEFEADRQFDAAVSVTVVQHITDLEEFERAFLQIGKQLRPGGQFVLLEAAPTSLNERCDSPIFRARELGVYRHALETAGMRIESIEGVDPMPLKTWILPYLRSLPRPLAVAAIGLVTAVSLPFDLMLARHLPNRSWHKLIVARREG